MEREIRICSKHGETEFALEKSGRWRCLKCQVEATQKRRNKVKEMAVEYKGGKCSVCGYDRCFRVSPFGPFPKGFWNIF